MKQMRAWLCLAITGGIAFSGCASIVGKSSYAVCIQSNPSGAEITVFAGDQEVVYHGRTPTTVSLKAGAGWFKGQDYAVEFEKAGYQLYRARIRRGVSGWYIVGNVFVGGLIGWLIVDPITGAMWTLEDLSVDLEAVAEATVHVPEAITLRVLTPDQVPHGLRSRMVRLD